MNNRVRSMLVKYGVLPAGTNQPSNNLVSSNEPATNPNTNADYQVGNSNSAVQPNQINPSLEERNLLKDVDAEDDGVDSLETLKKYLEELQAQTNDATAGENLLPKHDNQNFDANKNEAEDEEISGFSTYPEALGYENDAQQSTEEAKTTSTTSFGINGFGRIGRTSFRVWWQYHRESLDLKLVNTSGSMDLADWVHLLKYDSNYGQFLEPIQITEQQKKDQVSDENPILGTLKISDREIIVTAQRDPKKIPWGKYGVDVVIDSTGAFTTKDKAAQHLESGAKKVIISAPAKGGDISTSVIGVNEFDQNNQVRSNASCTTNCVAPIAQIMVEKLGVEKAMLTTIHSYTDDQNTQDNSHKDLRRARSAAENIIPTSTGAAIATTEIIPELSGIFDGLAVRVPTPTGSLSDMVFVTKRQTSVEEINQILSEAAQSERWQGILAVTNDPIVSSDVVGRRESSIADLSLTQVIGGNLVKIISWYDNEWGYCNRLIEQVAKA